MVPHVSGGTRCHAWFNANDPVPYTLDMINEPLPSVSTTEAVPYGDASQGYNQPSSVV